MLYENRYEMVGKIIEWSKRFETILTEEFGAEGKGLHEKISSVEDDLNNDVVKKLRYFATIRNKLVHDDNYNEINENFENTCYEIDKHFNEVIKYKQDLKRGEVRNYQQNLFINKDREKENKKSFRIIENIVATVIVGVGVAGGLLYCYKNFK